MHSYSSIFLIEDFSAASDLLAYLNSYIQGELGETYYQTVMSLPCLPFNDAETHYDRWLTTYKVHMIFGGQTHALYQIKALTRGAKWMEEESYSFM